MPSARLDPTSSRKPFVSIVAVACLLLSLVWVVSCAFNVEGALARSGQMAARPSRLKSAQAAPGWPVTHVHLLAFRGR